MNATVRFWRGNTRKYRNVPTTVDGVRLDSKREAQRYLELKMLLRTKKISALEVHPRFSCVVRGLHVCDVILDFSYWDVERGQQVIEDVKGHDTVLSRLKRKLVHACHGINVEVIK